MVALFRHRQTKEAETDTLGLTPPRHIPTLRLSAFAFTSARMTGSEHPCRSIIGLGLAHSSADNRPRCYAAARCAQALAARQRQARRETWARERHFGKAPASPCAAFGIDQRGGAGGPSIVGFNPVRLVAGPSLILSTEAHDENLPQFEALFGAIGENCDVANISIIGQLVAARQNPHLVRRCWRRKQHAESKRHKPNRQTHFHEIPQTNPTHLSAKPKRGPPPVVGNGDNAPLL